MTQEATELQRRASEARHYLRDGYTDRATVATLMERIRRNRGQAAADQLLADMREQWARRQEWIQELCP
ncbi:DUF7696 family protein [Xanthomonas citri]|uniref:DUF7696 family protein n=1 Tax=Xanthomonas citri TaxID=346 RepID=UPI0002D7B826|nr:hypothetical protein [Xanthomonas citri]AMU99477.1 hypothetical protein TP37_16355 [Xanthomonas citri pv. aurantifolii]AMV03984.1 hypothetical protein TP50_17255 [Xanthomonas citri pv. aurantifolii]MCC8490604.1 hypothetical protein [Xanthomonas citri pv. fuscans]TBW93784.1 hypothetical protein TP47_20245 [Xanthomonas citri pv. aurantifolii]TBW94088.1 hypothetical protein TP49_19895 [Xanthomonas citri pv. aurantifolii]